MGKLHSLGDHTENPDKKYWFMYTGPPDNTGSDPLRNIDQSTFAHILDRVPEFEGYLKTNECDMSKLSIVIEGMKDFCPLLEAAVKKMFDTFPNMCQAYSIIANEAVDVARDEGWDFTDRGTGKAIYNPSFDGNVYG
ncbi:hypothetical protein FOZ63_003505 [Perkinsus olseni]|uniref:Uncharacterized protein n=1 Tax=Perkinsus olseni TaxID=32597 RepID=A0A7J6R480_PEROL|nr:hypothetical protein FOZ63_003505 [Perkinsus olseni]